MLTYTIGEVAKLFDITKGGVRHYEKLGILTPLRDAQNGYRRYSRDNITTLKQIRAFQAMGFSLEAARAIAECPSDEHAMEAMCARQQALERQIELLTRSVETLRRRREVIREARERLGEWQLAARPALCRIPVWQERRPGMPAVDAARALSVERQWTANMSIVTLSDYYYRDASGRLQYEKGSCVLLEDAQRFGLAAEADIVEHYPPCRCLTGYVKCRAGGGVLDFVGAGLREAAARGLTIGDAMLGRLVSITRKDGERWVLVQVTLPIVADPSATD